MRTGAKILCRNALDDASASRDAGVLMIRAPDQEMEDAGEGDADNMDETQRELGS